MRSLPTVFLAALALAACKREAPPRMPAAPPPAPPALTEGGIPAMPPSGEPAHGGAPVAAPHRDLTAGPVDVKVEKVDRAAGADGRTVAEIWAQRRELAGKVVSVRGQVVKSTPVMGRVFLHLRDGTGSEAQRTNDLTVTVAESVAAGGVVTVRGKVAVDRDFGMGTPYPVMIEDAKVTR